MIPWLTRLVHRIGRRGCYLIFLALLDFVTAYSMKPSVIAAVGQRNPFYQYISRYLPLQAWALIWAAVGFICITQAFMRRDHFGFGMAVALKSVWAVLFLAAWIGLHMPLAWAGAVIWAGFAALTVVVAGWPEAWWLMLAATAVERERGGGQ